MRPHEVLKGQLAGRVHYFFVPVGVVQLGPTRLCKMDDEFPDVTIGNEVVLFVRETESHEGLLELWGRNSLVKLPGRAEATEEIDFKGDSWLQQEPKDRKGFLQRLRILA